MPYKGLKVDPLLFYMVSFTTKEFSTSCSEILNSLLTARALHYQSPCNKCLHFTIIFKFAAAIILRQSSKQTNRALGDILPYHNPSYEIIGYVICHWIT
jgi:hypothetical protein